MSCFNLNTDLHSTYLRPFNNNTPKQHECRTQKIVRIWCVLVFVEKAWVETKKQQQIWTNEWLVNYLRGVLDISLANTFPSCVIRTNLFAHLENKWTWSRLQIDPAITTWEQKRRRRKILNATKQMKWNVIKIQLCLGFFPLFFFCITVWLFLNLEFIKCVYTDIRWFDE